MEQQKPYVPEDYRMVAALFSGLGVIALISSGFVIREFPIASSVLSICAILSILAAYIFGEITGEHDAAFPKTLSDGTYYVVVTLRDGTASPNGTKLLLRYPGGYYRVHEVPTDLLPGDVADNWWLNVRTQSGMKVLTHTDPPVAADSVGPHRVGCHLG